MRRRSRTLQCLLVAGLVLLCVSPSCPAASNHGPASDAFRLRVNGTAVPVVRFSNDYDYALVPAAAGRSRIDIERIDGKPVTRANVSPIQLNVRPRVEETRVSFTIDSPEYLIVELEGLRRLVIALDAPERDRPPSMGQGIYNIASNPYRADATGQSDTTAAIQNAINAAGADPSGKAIVYVPAGVYRVTQLRLLSNISVYLEPDAVLRCDGSADQFTSTFKKKSVGRDGFWFIQANGVQNVRIFGRGTLDGCGKALHQQVKLINHVLAILNSQNVTVEGITLRDSGLWGTVIGNSDNVTLRDTKHFNVLDMGENDCVDVCNSRNVTVEHAIGISLDDPFSVKTWEPTTDVSSQWPGEFGEARDIRFDRCLAWTRCFGFKIGAGVLRPQQNIQVTRGVVYDAAHAVGISHSYGSADVRHVLFEDIDVERITCDCLGRSWMRFAIENRKKTSTAGGVQDITVRRINVRDAGKTPAELRGLNDSRQLHGIRFESVRMPGKSANAGTLSDMGIRESPFTQDVIVHP